MNILFIYPNVLEGGFIHLGIASLSAVLKKENHNTALFDTTFYNHSERQSIFKDIEEHRVTKNKSDMLSDLRLAINHFNPDLIAATSTSNSYNHLKNILQWVKFNYPYIPIVVGGPKATIDYKNIIRESFIDYAAVGESELSISEFVSNIENEKEISVSNIISKNYNIPKIMDFPPNLDYLPVPDFSIFNEVHMRRPMLGKMHRFGWIEFARGCPYSCNYCINSYLHSLYGKSRMKVRRKSIEHMISELAELKAKYRLDYLRFVDESFLNMPIKTLKGLVTLYINQISLPFIVMTHPSTVTNEKAKLLKEMGCTHVSIGVESGNDFIRNQICNRHITDFQIINAFKNLHDVGIGVTAFNIIGFPHEGRRQIFETINLNRIVKSDVPSVSYLYPFEGTKLYEYCIQNGYLQENDEVPEDYTAASVLKLNSITKEELEGLGKVFHLYCKYPRFAFPLIRLAENDNLISNKIFFFLNKIYKKHYAE